MIQGILHRQRQENKSAMIHNTAEFDTAMPVDERENRPMSFVDESGHWQNLRLGNPVFQQGFSTFKRDHHL
jgi:hypothetical protein